MIFNTKAKGSGRIGEVMRRAVAGSGDIPVALKEALVRIGRVERAEVQAESLSDLTDSLGEVHAGAWVASEQDPAEAGFSGTVIAWPAVEINGSTYTLYGMNSGVLQFGLDALTGRALFAGGQGVIDSTGMNLYGIRYALRHLATDTGGNNPRYGAFEMFYPDGATVPALRMLFYDGEGTNLLPNGNFPGGSTTGWTVVSTATSTAEGIVVSRTYTYTNSTGIAMPYTLGTSIESDYVSVTAGERYSLLTTPGRDTTIRWYTSGNTLISSAVAGGGSGVLVVPATAAKAKIYIEKSQSGYIPSYSTRTITVEFPLTSVFFGAVPMVHSLAITDDGLNVDGLDASVLVWNTAITAGVDQDFVTGGTVTAVACPIRVKADAIRLTGMLWDIRSSGSYELRYTWDTSSGNSYKTLWTGTAPGSSEVTITFTEPLVLPRGEHFLTLVRTAAAIVYLRSGTTPYSNDDVIINRAYNDSAIASAIAPVKLIYQPGEWS